MSLMKVSSSSVNLEERIVILERKVQKILKHLGQTTSAPPKSDSEKNDDDYCCIS